MIKNLQRLSDRQDIEEVRACMVLENILLQDHLKDFLYKAVNDIAGMKIEGKITSKNLEVLSLEKQTCSPNQETVEESLVIRNVQSMLSQI